MKRTKKGFTLVELLVVIAILAILASVSVVGYTAFIEKADKSVAEQELHQVVTYINAELLDDGEWTFTVPAQGENAAVTHTLKVEGNALVCADIDAMIKASGEFNGIEGTFSLDGNKLVFAPQGQTWTVSATLTF